MTTEEVISSPQVEPTEKDRRRAIWAASVGNFVEWFDFGFYGYLAVTIGAVFFPGTDPTASLLATFAVFGAAFLVRPLGAMYFGSVGDRIGRNKVLAVTILVMSSATFLVALLPGYATIGIAAPILLLLLRMVQGFAAGGEPGGAATFLAEYSPKTSRGLSVSFWHVSSFLALICSSGLALLLYSLTTPEQMIAWGWRLPFLLALPAGIIGLYIRMRIEDTPEFRRLEKLSEKAQAPLRDVIRIDRLPLLKTFFLAALQQFGFYVVFVYLAVYMKVEAGFSSSEGTVVTMAAVATAMVVVAPFGALSDRIGRKPVLIATSVTMAIAAIPLMHLLNSGGLALAVLAGALLAVPLGGFMGAAAATYTELFTTRRRYAGMSLAFGVAAALFGGTAPYLSTYATQSTGSPVAPAYLLIGFALVSLVAAITLRESARVSLDKI